MSETQTKENDLRESLKRCPERTIEAAIAFQSSRDPQLVPVIVMGIIERFVEPDVRPVVREGGDGIRLLEDLALDSLLMVEIVIMVEETLGIRIENEELRHLRTLGDLKSYLDAKVQGIPVAQRQRVYSFAEVASVMPHQPPFLFLQDARVNGDEASGSYLISRKDGFLEGHFPGNPVFPASLMIEALGQLAVLFLIQSENPQIGGKIDPASVYFVSCDGVRCHRVCRPDETLLLKIRLKKVHAPIAQFEGTILVNGARVARAEEISLTFQLADAASSTAAAW
jgi:3-hydroxymyristoyl/3-hydroxydecanoyl-(acyl carrier protein) dehydratase/acyl carrier protein